MTFDPFCLMIFSLCMSEMLVEFIESYLRRQYVVYSFVVRLYLLQSHRRLRWRIKSRVLVFVFQGSSEADVKAVHYEALYFLLTECLPLWIRLVQSWI